ncbi:hypothetical protein [Thiolapillus sp.]
MFRLLLQSNPNYFGNSLSSSLPARKVVGCNIWYEEILCLGYNPQERLLAAVICLHQPGGYATGTRVSSEREYVRFYLSYDDGKNWEDQGCASVDVYNVTTVTNRQHAVSVELAKDEDQFPSPHARLRAILSWGDMPPEGVPEWKPVFGNVAETTVCLSSANSRESVAAQSEEESDERLCGIGMAMQDDALLAVVHVGRKKRLSSRHHVTFWLDSDDSGAFETYLGVVDMSLAALGEIPGEGADYVLRLPVDLEAYRQDCAESSRILRVRGILSGSESGSRSKFRCVPAERGYVDTCLTIAPRVHAVPGEIAIIGGVPAKTMELDTISLPEKNGASDGFMIQGVPLPRHSYVVEVSADGRNWKPLLDEVMVMDANAVVCGHKPDSQTGRFEYLSFEKNISGVLACWDGAGVGKWQLRLRNYFGGILLPESDVVVVCLQDELLSDGKSDCSSPAVECRVTAKPADSFAAAGMHGEFRWFSA